MKNQGDSHRALWNSCLKSWILKPINYFLHSFIQYATVFVCFINKDNLYKSGIFLFFWKKEQSYQKKKEAAV